MNRFTDSGLSLLFVLDVLLLDLCTLWMVVVFPMFRTSIFRFKMMASIHVVVAFGPVDSRRNSPCWPGLDTSPHTLSQNV
jgi:hypothetical protein